MLAFSTRTFESSGVPARRVQPGGFCVGMLPLACSTPACPGSWLSCVFVRFTGYAFWLHALLSARIPSSLSFTVLAGSTSGSGRGLSAIRSRGLLAALGSCKSGCPSCFADASERGVNPRLEVGGSACVAPALRSRGCGCFCLRLDFQVAVSVRGSQGTWVLSACL